MAEMWLVRIALVVFTAGLAAYLEPLGWERSASAAAGAAAAATVVVLEFRLRQVSLRRLIGAALGSVLSILGAYLVHLIFVASLDAAAASVLSLAVLLPMSYCGVVVGAAKGEMLNLAALGGLFGGDPANHDEVKILDTSVIIDGRIADIAETGFLDGDLMIPQFVLWELQLVADSHDSMKRARGRRGLDILRRIQKMTHIHVRIVENDYPQLKDVDLKLIELAKELHGKVVTNDFNLNKVARLQGVHVLNINDLANSLKPVVLPGETMRVFILKEGKEYNQGVAYLDDGTMVVVDGARRYISKTIEINVTSVLQTAAGKMIFGRYGDRGQEASVGAASAMERSTPRGSGARAEVEHGADH